MDNENLNGTGQGTGPVEGIDDSTQVAGAVGSGTGAVVPPDDEFDWPIAGGADDSTLVIGTVGSGTGPVVPPDDDFDFPIAGGADDSTQVVGAVSAGAAGQNPPPADGTVAFDSSLTGPVEDNEDDVDQIIADVRGITGEDPPPPPFRDDDYRMAFGEGEELEAVFNEVEPAVPTPPPAAPKEEEEDLASQAKNKPKKVRPRMKKGYGFFGIPHLIASCVWLLIILALGVTLGRLMWVCAADVLAFGKEPKEAQIHIYQSDDMQDIADKLHEAGLIEYPGLFKLYMELTDNEVEPGEHTLSAMIYDYHAIKTALEPQVAARETVKVVIPEGYTCAQIFALLEEKGVCTVAELEAYSATGDLNDYWFLEGVERGDKYCLEGYLFPDTYQFYKGHDPELALEKMLDGFDLRFTDIMKAKLDPLNERLAKTLRSRGYSEDYIASHKITIREVVIIASMIERETSSDSESYEIASVIYNRLTNPGNFPYLNIDATVIYGLGGKIDPETGESIPLTKADLEFDTPYNSYTRKGLIPGPISNPGRTSLNAALDPNDTAYYYYVFSPNAGKHLFAKTAAEHDQNVNKVRSQRN